MTEPVINPVRFWRPVALGTAGVILALGATWYVAWLVAELAARNASTDYVLEGLMNSEDRRRPPAEIESQLLELEADNLADDRRQSLCSEDEAPFAAVPIRLGREGPDDFLVCPARYLPSLCGAHSISFWVFKARPDGGYGLVLSGCEDAVRIWGRRTRGLRDIDMIYWSAAEEVTSFRYDGRRYREVAAKPSR